MYSIQRKGNSYHLMDESNKDKSKVQLIPENTCETIEITPDLLRLFTSLEKDYNRIKSDIKSLVISSTKPT